MKMRSKKFGTFCKLTAAMVVVSSGAVSMRYAIGDDSVADFKFPVTLCVFKVARIKDVGGKPHIKSDDFTSEFAYRVENLQALNTRDHTGRLVRVYTGDFSGQYEVPDSAYRIRFEGEIQQGGQQDGQQKIYTMKLHSYLDKRDAKSGNYVSQGQNLSQVQTTDQADGSVWENVYSYAKNDTEFASVMKSDSKTEKVDSTKLLDAVRDGKLNLGDVASAGPVCGLLDVRTAKRITTHRGELSDIFAHVPDLSPAPGLASVTLVAKSKPVESAAPTASNKMSDSEEASERAEQERLANGGDPTQKSETGVAPVSQDEVAKQNQLADAEASRYSQESAQAQGETPQGIFSTPPTVAWPEPQQTPGDGSASTLRPLPAEGPPMEGALPRLTTEPLPPEEATPAASEPSTALVSNTSPMGVAF